MVGLHIDDICLKSIYRHRWRPACSIFWSHNNECSAKICSSVFHTVFRLTLRDNANGLSIVSEYWQRQETQDRSDHDILSRGSAASFSRCVQVSGVHLHCLGGPLTSLPGPHRTLSSTWGKWKYATESPFSLVSLFNIGVYRCAPPLPRNNGT